MSLSSQNIKEQEKIISKNKGFVKIKIKSYLLNSIGLEMKLYPLV